MSEPRPDALDILPARPPRQAMGDGGLRLAAPAKLNLFLHVVGRRADGYHLLQTLFRFIDYSDTLYFTPREDGMVRRTNELAGVPQEQDLCVRAARLLRIVEHEPSEVWDTAPPGVAVRSSVWSRLAPVAVHCVLVSSRFRRAVASRNRKWSVL